MNDSQTENQKPEENKQEETKPVFKQKTHSIGQILKKARIDQKIEIEQICNQLNLSSHVVEALESDNYENLPEIAYIRGYIVSYCRVLGLDSFLVLKKLVTDDPNLSISNSIISSVGSAGGNTQTKSSSRFLLPLLFAVIVGSGIWYYLQNSNPTSADQSQKNVTSSNEQANENNQENVVENSNTQQTETPTQTNEVVEEGKIQLLELEFDAVSWVDVENSSNERIVYQSFPRGEKFQVKAALPLNIFIDNAKGVFLRYEGRLIDLNPYITDGYAKFTLNE